MSYDHDHDKMSWHCGMTLWHDIVLFARVCTTTRFASHRLPLCHYAGHHTSCRRSRLLRPVLGCNAAAFLAHWRASANVVLRTLYLLGVLPREWTPYRRRRRLGGGLGWTEPGPGIAPRNAEGVSGRGWTNTRNGRKDAVRPLQGCDWVILIILFIVQAHPGQSMGCNSQS